MEKDEAIKILKDFHDESAIFSVRTALETLHPEFRESEDERIRKALIKGVESCKASGWTNFGNNVDIDVVLAWLEKQEGCECIKKDWLEHIKQSWYKEGFIDGKYTPKELTINDVATLNELIDFLENGTAKLQHDLTLYANWLKTQFPQLKKQGEQKPTDEDMKEALRTEYEKGRADAFAQMQKKWSEEDEQYLLVCKNALAKYQTTDKWDADIISCWLENKLKAPQNTLEAE